MALHCCGFCCRSFSMGHNGPLIGS